MLTITIPAVELWDERKQEFVVYMKEQTLKLEHSLVSLSKWEQKWNKSFLSKDDKTFEETIDYIKCMTITQNVKPETYNYLTKKNIEEISNYIGSPMTATTFSNTSKGNSRERITAEVIYDWMFTLGIPMECEKWHLNRLITQIRVTELKRQPGKKMSQKDVIQSYAEINAARRKQLNSKG